MDDIELLGIHKQYLDQRGHCFVAVDDVSLTINAGESMALIGQSGSGKSTLARLMLGLELPDQGSIAIKGSNIACLSPREWRGMRRIIQGVFQDAGGTFNSQRSVYHNIEEALVNVSELTGSERRSRIYELMEVLGLDRALLRVPVRHLSGGEQRRLSLIRALSIHPEFLVLDEVTSGLDLISANAVADLLESYREQHQCSYVFITHDVAYAKRLCSTIHEMECGRIVRSGHIAG